MDDDLAGRVAARVAALTDPANMASLKARMGAIKTDREGCNQAAAQAQRAKSFSAKVYWLHQLGERFAASALPHSACARGGRGCDACCRMAVSISAAEALYIATKTGRKLAPDAGGHALAGGDVIGQAAANQDRFTGTDCPFLQDGACSVYEWRPLVCRTHISLDEDALLCDVSLRDLGEVIPYLDQTAPLMVQVGVYGMGMRYADVRDWFGGGK